MPQATTHNQSCWILLHCQALLTFSHWWSCIKLCIIFLLFVRVSRLQNWLILNMSTCCFSLDYPVCFGYCIWAAHTNKPVYSCCRSISNKVSGALTCQKGFALALNHLTGLWTELCYPICECVILCVGVCGALTLTLYRGCSVITGSHKTTDWMTFISIFFKVNMKQTF